jgi:hypothetical protein
MDICNIWKVPIDWQIVSTELAILDKISNIVISGDFPNALCKALQRNPGSAPSSAFWSEKGKANEY